MPNISTGDVSKRLGFLVTRDFIENTLNVEPEEIVKSHPKWSEDNFKTICAALVDHISDVAMAPAKPVPKTIKAVKTVAKPVVVEDDDEL